MAMAEAAAERVEDGRRRERKWKSRRNGFKPWSRHRYPPKTDKKNVKKKSSVFWSSRGQAK
jgi:hypothetical protein